MASDDRAVLKRLIRGSFNENVENKIRPGNISTLSEFQNLESKFKLAIGALTGDSRLSVCCGCGRAHRTSVVSRSLFRSIAHDENTKRPFDLDQVQKDSLN